MIRIGTISRRAKMLGAAAGLPLALGMLAGTALAATIMLAPFTQSELDDNWEPDRQVPSGGITSVSAFGRVDVAQLGIDSALTHAAPFRRTEGMKTIGALDFGNAVQVDLYLDPDWANKAVRAGFWVVGDNGSGARDEKFGILEFVNLEPSTSGVSAQGNHTGWRFWVSSVGWTDLETDYTLGTWVTLTVELDTTAQQYKFYIDGTLVASGAGGQNFIRELFLNSYNYGLDAFPNLSNDSYAAHWHAGLLEPETRQDCKEGGWEAFGFKNQGLCLQFVNTGKDSR